VAAASPEASAPPRDPNHRVAVHQRFTKPLEDSSPGVVGITFLTREFFLRYPDIRFTFLGRGEFMTPMRGVYRAELTPSGVHLVRVAVL
jgi:hypothetical protein